MPSAAAGRGPRSRRRPPKALALDPTPSAPGVEPVVLAVRIVSTDPKALKTGGLCVALKGAPVSPADEVDAATEYQLIALTDGGGSSDVTPVQPE